MNIRQAILRAADHIERNPASYNFHSNRKPDCGTPGCMLGWIGIYLGVARKQPHAEGWTVDVAAAIGTTLGEFINERIHAAADGAFRGDDWAGWQRSANGAARALRLYADKYHPATKREGIPPEVRAIFNRSLPVVIS